MHFLVSALSPLYTLANAKVQPRSLDQVRLIIHITAHSLFTSFSFPFSSHFSSWNHARVREECCMNRPISYSLIPLPPPILSPLFLPFPLCDRCLATCFTQSSNFYQSRPRRGTITPHPLAADNPCLHTQRVFRFFLFQRSSFAHHRTHPFIITHFPPPFSPLVYSTYLACGLFARGGGIQVSDLQRNVAKIKSQVRMAAWNSDGFKIGLCSVPPVGLKQSGTMASIVTMVICQDAWFVMTDLLGWICFSLESILRVTSTLFFLPTLQFSRSRTTAASASSSLPCASASCGCTHVRRICTTTQSIVKRPCSTTRSTAFPH